MTESSRMTVKEIAQRLKLGEQTVREMLEAGQIPAIPIGKGARSNNG